MAKEQLSYAGGNTKMEMIWPKKKMYMLAGIIALWLVIGLIVKTLVFSGIIAPLPPTPITIDRTDQETSFDALGPIIETSKAAAQSFLEKKLVTSNGHVNLIYPINASNNPEFREMNYTNSEAISYYLLYNAVEKNKENYDRGINFLSQKMINPELDYLMWKLDERDVSSGNDRNMASDADLRVLTSLFLAEEEWQDKNYTIMIDRLVGGLETIGVTDDYYLAPYGGINNGGLWKAEEVWISYVDFEALRKLSLRYGNPWTKVYENMKQAVLKSQIPSGLYNSTLNPDRTTSSSLDNGNYSINSLWIMVRSAESKDPQLTASAKKALNVYKKSFAKNARIVTSYTEGGEEASDDESPWAYALVARAAIELGDNEMAEIMINKMVTYQDLNPKSSNYGAILEGSETTYRTTQFTMHETILTLQSLTKE